MEYNSYIKDRCNDNEAKTSLRDNKFEEKTIIYKPKPAEK